MSVTTKTANKRRPKGEVLEALDAAIAQGQALRGRAIPDDLGLALVAIERMGWSLDVLALLPHMSRGIQVAADFNRAASVCAPAPGDALAAEVTYFHAVLDAQLDGLAKAVDRWRKSGTRPLT